jgi:molecular chaperone DnaK
MSGHVIGIDLGTTHSEVSYVDGDGRPVVISIDGSPLVPSVVSLGSDGGWLVGQAAVNNELNAPTDTVRWIKRRMGQDSLIAVGGKPCTPAQISSLILRHLRLAAETHLGGPVTQAVITVPAFFGERAREDTREAARQAGLEVLRLINEPTAAASAYAMGNRREETWLVYDLGGGTFDVSVVACSEAVMEVRASHGDVNLGGHDFDRELAGRAADDFRIRHGIDLQQDPRQWARVLRAAERAKIRLSTHAEAVVHEEYIADGAQGTRLHLEFAVRRTVYEAMIMGAIERTLVSVRTALERAGIAAEQLSRVLLVGGVTRTPLVQAMLAAELGVQPQAWINPDTVVAQGAAIEAAALAGRRLGAVMVDVTPHSLGVAAVSYDGTLHVVPLIHRNTPLPAQASQVFYRQSQDQDRIDIEVFQGESEDLNLCHSIGLFTLDKLTHSESKEVLCRFDLDRSGILTINVTDVGSARNLVRRIDQVQEVRSADLSDLTAVRLSAPLSVSADVTPDDYGSQRPDDGDDASAKNIDATADLRPGDRQPDAPDLESLRERAGAILARTSVDPLDAAELRDRLKSVENDASPAARQTLADLVYFLE